VAAVRRTGAAGPPTQSRRGYAAEIVRRRRDWERAEKMEQLTRDARDLAVAAGLRAGLTHEMAARASGLSVGMVRHIARTHREIVPPGKPGPKPQPTEGEPDA
jgi:hypothetical protein